MGDAHATRVEGIGHVRIAQQPLDRRNFFRTQSRCDFSFVIHKDMAYLGSGHQAQLKTGLRLFHCRIFRQGKGSYIRVPIAKSLIDLSQRLSRRVDMF